MCTFNIFNINQTIENSREDFFPCMKETGPLSIDVKKSLTISIIDGL